MEATDGIGPLFKRIMRRPPKSGKTRDNPGTSKDAYREITDELGPARARVYCALIAGPGAAWEVERALGTSGLWRRFSELERLGLIERTGEERVNPKTKKACAVYRAVPAERVAACAHDMAMAANELKDARAVADRIMQILNSESVPDYKAIRFARSLLPNKEYKDGQRWVRLSNADELRTLARAVQKRVKR